MILERGGCFFLDCHSCAGEPAMEGLHSIAKYQSGESQLADQKAITNTRLKIIDHLTAELYCW